MRNSNAAPVSPESPAKLIAAARTWRRPPWVCSRAMRWTFGAGTLIYLTLALASLDINWPRVYRGLARGWQFIQGFLIPDFATRGNDILAGMQESLTMTVTATVVGILISVPVGIGAARNLAGPPVYFFCRGLIALSRSLQEIIVAIFFVAMFGFGAFAGFLTLSFATIGFLSKLLAEDIEAVDETQAEAIRATGARWWQVVNYAIQPQVMPRLIGLSCYRFDINFRESAVIGIVGAGGIGGTLNTAIERYEYDSAGAILILIITIVMGAEYFSGYVRKWVK